MEISKYKTWSWEELLKMNLNKKELAKEMGITTSHDTALPIQWLSPFCKKNENLTYDQIVYYSFMVYSPDDSFGKVYSALNSCQQALNKEKFYLLVGNLGNKYAQAIASDLQKLCGIDIQSIVPNLTESICKNLDNFNIGE